MELFQATGLNAEEAAERLARIGPNEIAAGGGRSLWSILLETMREPMFLLLVVALFIIAFVPWISLIAPRLLG